MSHLTSSKFAHFWALWQTGYGDTLHRRDETFGGRTVAELVVEIRAFEAGQSTEPRDIDRRRPTQT